MSTIQETQSRPELVSAGLDLVGGSLARWLFALPFAAFGAMHLAQPAAFAPYVPAWIPGGGVFWVVVTGLAMVGAGAAIAANRLVVPAALGLAAMVFGFIVTIHLPGVLDEATRAYSQAALLKDLALVGAALMLVGSQRRATG